MICLGYNQKDFGCILSKYENNLCDKFLLHAYRDLKIKYKKFSFFKEDLMKEQYNSPFIDLPIAKFLRLNLEIINNTIHLWIILIL